MYYTSPLFPLGKVVTASAAALITGASYANGPVLETRLNPLNSHTYYLLDAGTWTEAEAIAVSLGGHLVSINNSEENAWLYETFGTTRNLWIGLYADAAGWHWSNGDAVTYQNWWDLSHGYAGGEPYAVMGTGSHPSQWDDWQNVTPWPVNNNPIFGVAEVSEPSLATMFLAGLGLLIATSARRKIS